MVFKRPVNHNDYIRATPAWTLNAVLYKVKRTEGKQTNRTKQKTKKREREREREKKEKNIERKLTVLNRPS